MTNYSEKKQNKLSDLREQRRLEALLLKEKGWSNSKIANELGVSKGAVSQWMQKVQQFGKSALLHKSPPGQVPRLTQAQMEELSQLLLEIPETYGIEGQIWTSKKVRQLIENKFHISFHRVHVCRIIKQLDILDEI